MKTEPKITIKTPATTLKTAVRIATRSRTTKLSTAATTLESVRSESEVWIFHAALDGIKVNILPDC